jgi:hypothetical protein
VRRLIAITAAVAGLVAAGCGSGTRASLTPKVARELGAEVAQIRVDAVGGNVGAATLRLLHLRTRVGELRTSGEISSNEAARVLSAVDGVSAVLSLASPSSAPATTSAPTTTRPKPHDTKPRKGHGGGGDGGD